MGWAVGVERRAWRARCSSRRRLAGSHARLSPARAAPDGFSTESPSDPPQPFSSLPIPLPSLPHPQPLTMDRLLQPPLHIKTLSAQPLAPADAQKHLAAFLDQFQARARDALSGGSSADADGAAGGGGGGGSGAVEGSLLARLVEGLEHEVKAKQATSA